MNKELSQKHLSIKVNFLDVLFFVLLATTFYFTRNIVCRLMMLLFFAYFAGSRLLSRNTAIKPSFFFVSYTAFIGYGAVMLFFGDVINTGVVRTMVVSLVLNLMMIYSIVLYVKRRNSITAVLKTFEWSIFIVAVVVLAMSLPTITSGRLGGGTEINANTLSMLCVYGMVMSMALVQNKEMTTHSFWVKAIFYLLVVLLTGSRKGLLMIVIALGTLMMVKTRGKFIVNILKILAVVAILYIAIMYIPLFYNIIGIRIEGLLNYALGSDTAVDGSLLSRQYLIDVGMNYIKENKWLGYGLDCFKLVSGTGSSGQVSIGEVGYYSHNNYIELLFGVGIIGTVLYYIPMFWIFIKLLKRIYSKCYAPHLLALFISKIAVEYAYVSYYSRIDAYITAIIVGVILYWEYEDRIDRREIKYGVNI